MSLDRVVISVSNVGKRYRIWADPRSRLSGSLGRRLEESRWCPRWVGKWGGAHYRRVCREFHAREGVGFSVREGEAVGIVGRNGSGKSTLLQIIAGTLQPTAGRVVVDGRVAALLELGSGFNPEFTGRENVFLNAAVLGLSRRETEERYSGIVSFADIGDFVDQPVKTYSSGMLLRLAFAVQTAVDPAILIVDEALSVGDETFQRKCFARMERIREAGTTILFVSHDASSVVSLCSRALFLHRGRLVLEGDPKYVVSRYQRFCHAPDSLAEETLASILQEDAKERARDRKAVPGSERPAPATGPANLAEKAGAGTPGGGEDSAPERWSEEECFNPNLLTRSEVRYEPQGAEISEVGIETEDGRPVNQLRRRRWYVYRYRVTFLRDCEEVAFAMLVKTPKGQDLGGRVTRAADLRVVKAGSVYTVRFRFQCLLNPWTYFLNAGVEARLGDRRAYAHRVFDAFVFRVLAEHGSLSTGVVDFLCQPEVVAEDGSVANAASDP